MKQQISNSIFQNPRTTIGGFLCLVAAAGLLLHRIDAQTAITLIGTGAGIAGLTGKDSSTEGPK